MPPTAIRREGFVPCLGNMREGNLALRDQEQENEPHSLMSAALGELAEAFLKS